MKTIIRISILLLALAPAIVVAVILIGYLNKTRIQDLEYSLTATGRVIVDQLAAASRHALGARDIELLEALARSAMRMPAVARVTIEDAGGEAVVDLNQADGRGLSGRFLRQFEVPVYAPGGDGARGAPQAGNPDRRLLGRVRVAVSREALAYSHKQVIRTSFLLLLGALPIVALFGWHMGRKICEPFFRLERLVGRLRTEGFARSPWGVSLSELGDLGRDIRATRRVLEACQKHLQKHVDNAATDLHARVEKLQAENQALDAARQRAVEAGRAKSAFLAELSGEIRTPLNAMMQSIGRLARTETDPARQACWQELRVSVEALRAVLDDIRDFTRIDSGRFGLRKHPFAIREVLESALKPFEEGARRNRLELSLNIDPDIPATLTGDASCIARIVITLVRRMIELAESGQVGLRVSKELESNRKITLGLEIRHTQLRLDPAGREEMVAVSVPADGYEAEPFDASLGLDWVIVRQLVTLMEGHIHVRRRQAATGSVIVVSLVVDKVHVQGAVATRALSSSESF